MITENETILMAEDDPGVCNCVKSILQRLGYVVLTATNASDAQDVCERIETTSGCC